MRAQKHWTKEEENYLEMSFGIMDTRSISRHLERPVRAIVERARIMGLSVYDTRERYTIPEVGKIINKGTSTVRRNIASGKMKKQTTFYTGKVQVVDREDLIDFMENYPHLVDWRNEDILKEYDLWQYKPKDDVQIYREWTLQEEENMLKWYREGKTFKEIGERLGRTENAISIRVYKADKRRKEQFK